MGVLRIELLGNSAVSWDGAPVALRRKPYELLCLLVSARVRPVDESWLVHHLWRGRPPTTASTALRVHLSNLRSALEPARASGPSSRIARTVSGWRLRADPAELDVLSFETTVAEAAAALGTGEAERALTLSRAALAAWQGRPFPGVDLEPVAAETARLVVLHQRSVQLCRTAALQSGHGGDVLDELRRAHADEPRDEEVLGQLVVAQYQSSGQQPALDLLRSYRRSARTAGLEPAPTLDLLEGRILRHELPGPAPAWGSRAPAAVEPAELLGRQDLLLTLTAHCLQHQTVLLRGHGGVGKSSVLQQVSLPGHLRIRIACSSHMPPLGGVRALLAASPVPLRDADGWQRLRGLLHEASTGATPTSVVLLAEDLVRDLFQENRLLILLDDADRLDGVSAAVLRAGLQAEPRTRLVLAARASPGDPPAGALAAGPGAGLEPDAVLVVPPLDPPAAARLLARLRAGGGHDRLDDPSALEAAAGSPWLLDLVTADQPGTSTADTFLTGLSTAGFRAAVLLAVCKVPLDLVDADELLGRAVLEELLVTTIATTTGQQCSLRHDLIGELVLEAADPEVRRSTAARAFRQLSGRHGDALALAGLVAEAGSELTAAEQRSWAVAAGWEALRGGDAGRAAGYFTLAGDPEADTAETGLSRLGRARCLDQLGELAAARRWYVRAMTAYQAAGSDAGVRDALLSYVGMFAPAPVEAAVVDSVTEWLLARQRLDPSDLLAVLDARAGAALEAGSDARGAGEALVEASRQVLTPLGALYGLHGRWRQGHHEGRSQRQQVLVTASCVELAEQVGDQSLFVRALRTHADSLLATGRPDESEQALARLAAVARDVRLPQALWWVDVMQASTAIRRDDLAAGVQLAARAHDRWQDLPAGQRAEMLQLQQLVVAYQSGQLAPLADQLGALVDEAPDPTQSLVPAASLAVDAQLGRVSDPHG